ncbi:hypothetical protein MD484_g4298, partial [Candolleomyces efflorescens]
MLRRVTAAGDPIEELLRKLSDRASSDPDAECRSEVVRTFFDLPPSHGEFVKILVEERFHQGIKDKSQEVRHSWVKLAGTQIKDAEFPELTTLVQAAINDSDCGVQDEAMKILQRLLEQANSRALMAAKLGEVLGTSLGSPEHTKRAMEVLRMVTKPHQTSSISSASVKRHELWAQITMLFSHQQSGFSANLVEAAIKGTFDIFQSQDAFCSFFDDDKLPKPIDTALPILIESTLRLDAAASARSFAINVFGSLIGCVPGHGDSQPKYEKLLAPHYNSQIIMRLADIVIKDNDRNLKPAALGVLKLAYKAQDQYLPGFVQDSLSKIIKLALEDEDTTRREKAVSVVAELTEENTNDDYSDIVSPSVPQLLKIVLIEGNKDLGERVKRVLGFYNPVTEIAKLNNDVLVAIPPLVAETTTVVGKEIIIRLTERLSEDIAFRIACALTPMLKSTASFARGIVIELLLKLYVVYGVLKPKLIESAIPEIISLAFDDKDDVGEIRTTAIQLLVVLSSSAGQSEPSSGLKKVTLINLATRFMDLLQDEHLRPAVVALLSSISRDDTARETIVLRIASMAFGPENPDLVGYVELLVHLISDGAYYDLTVA